MNNTDQIKLSLSMATLQLPTMLVCLVACVVIFIKWKEASRGSIWALVGFGLALALCFVIPIVQTSLQRVMMQSGSPNQQMASFYKGLSILWSVLRAATYAFLLVAVFAGRSTPQPASAPPLGPE